MEQITIAKAEAIVDLCDMLSVELVESAALLAKVGAKQPLTAADRLRASEAVRVLIGCIKDIRTVGRH